jgi:hypothetical protein
MLLSMANLATTYSMQGRLTAAEVLDVKVLEKGRGYWVKSIPIRC